MKLVSDSIQIGNRLRTIRKQRGFTQMEVADRADISERAFADIERGSQNMRIDTLCKICTSLEITPDYLLVDNHEEDLDNRQEQMFHLLEKCPPRDRERLLGIMAVYFKNLFDFEI